MAANRPLLFFLFMCLQRGCTRCCVRPTHILQHFCVCYFVIKFSVMLLVSKHADPWHENTDLAFVHYGIYECI